AINKADKRGAEDALRDVRKTVQRNRGRFEEPLEQMPVFLSAANRFADDGVDRLFSWLMAELGRRVLPEIGVLTLHVSTRNAAALRAYERAGYVRTAELRLAIFPYRLG
ncbi:MAG: hypothetical protein ABFS86_19895, partial [Planctomycetota bacterium]